MILVRWAIARRALGLEDLDVSVLSHAWMGNMVHVCVCVRAQHICPRMRRTRLTSDNHVVSVPTPVRSSLSACLLLI